MFKTAHLLMVCMFVQLTACAGADEMGTSPPLGAADSAEPAQASAALASDACKNVEITVKNSFFYDGRERQMRVLYVKFFSASEGAWFTEGLANEVIAYGQKHTWKNQNLAHAENDLLTKWRVYFQYRESDGDWSDTVYQQLDTPNDICRADDNYTLTVS